MVKKKYFAPETGKTEAGFPWIWGQACLKSLFRILRIFVHIKNMKKALPFLFLLATLFTNASTPYKGTGGKITDKGGGVYFALRPTGIGHKAMNDTFGLESVTIKLNHPDVSQLEIWVQAPDGTFTPLYYANQTGKNFDSTIFSDTGTINISVGKAPFRGNFKPYNSQLKTINNGQNPDSTWNLYIKDSYSPAGKGTLVYWYLTFGNHPAWDVKLDSSNLPILNINTRNNSIYHGYKNDVYLDVIYNGPGKWNHLKDSLKNRGYAGLDIRGASSSGFPKKSFGLETRDSLWQPFNVALLGLPKDNDWALEANYSDKTLMNNYLAYELSRQFGQHAPRTKMCEVVVNGVYQGVYLLVEKIKITKDRVSISKLNPGTTSGDSLTGGYICKIDWTNGVYIGGWYSKYYASCHPSNQQIFIQYDQPSSITSVQEDYIHSYVDSFEDSLNGTNYQNPKTGWRKYADEGSFIDYFLVDELSKNVDGYRLSTYFYKDRNSVDGGKLHMGPVWDYDLSFSNANYGDESNFSSWQYSYYCDWIPFWWQKFLKDTTFKNDMKCRWSHLRKVGFLRDSALTGKIDSMASYIDLAQKRNFNQWNILGVYVWPNTCLPVTYARQLDTMKYWIKKRAAWMDKNIKGTCRVDYDPPSVSFKSFDTAYLEVFNHYIDSGITYYDKRDGTNCNIIISSNVDSSTLGTYQYWYDVYDQSKNKTSKCRIVKVIDTLPPSITFTKGDTIPLEVYTQYTGKDITILDNYDNAPTVTKSGSFSFPNNIPDTLGTFYLQYSATDQSGNTGSRTRYIKVVDSIAPSISLKGQSIVVVNQNDFYSDSGYVYLDNYDKYPMVDTSGTFIDTKTPGTYFINYKVRDHSGNIGKAAIRTVNVNQITGIAANISQQQISIYPNPTSGRFTFEALYGNETMHVSMFDALGQRIGIEFSFSGNTLREIAFPSGAVQGIYYLKIQSESFTQLVKIVYMK